MKERKVSSLLALLTPKETRKLLPWLQLELPPRQQKVYQLCELLLQKESAEHIWDQLFDQQKRPDDLFGDPGFRRLETELTRYIEYYLAWLSFRKDSGALDLYLIHALNQRNAEQLFIIQWNKIRRRIESRHERGNSYYYQLYELEKLFHFFQMKHVELRIDRDRQDYFNLFDAWWIHEKLRLNLIHLNDRLQGKAQYDLRLIEEAFQLVENDPEYSSMPVLRIYWLTYRMLRHQEESYELVSLLWMHGDWLKTQELQDIFMSVLNFYTRKYYQEKTQYYRQQLLNLYDWGLDRKLLIRDGVIPWQLYRNLVVLRLQAGRIADSLTFIEEYASYLPSAEREETSAYCQALCHFETRDYRKAIRLLNQRYHQPSIELSARILRIKSRYERGERIEIEEDIRALRIFLERRKDISELVRQNMQNDLVIMQRLILATTPDQQQQLIAQIQKTDPLTHRDWYLDKLGGQ